MTSNEPESKSDNVAKELVEKKSGGSQKISQTDIKSSKQSTNVIGKFFIIIFLFIIGGNFLQSFLVFLITYSITHNTDVAQGAVAIFPFFLATFPITATTTMGILLYKYHVDDIIPKITITFVVTVLLSICLGIGGIGSSDLPAPSSNSNIFSFAIGEFWILAVKYGPLKFFLSLITGGLIAWAMSKYVISNPDKKS